MGPCVAPGQAVMRLGRLHQAVPPRPRETCLSRTAAQSALCCLAVSTLVCLSLVLSGLLKPAFEAFTESGLWRHDNSDLPLGRLLHHPVQAIRDS